MKILFIHRAFPGQFIHIAPFLARNLEATVLFLTESRNPQNLRFPGIQSLQFVVNPISEPHSHPYLRLSENAILRGQEVVKQIEKLLRNDFRPDVVIVQAGLGYGMYLKDILPSVRVIDYLEWFAHIGTSHHLFAKPDLNTALTLKTESWPLLHEMSSADDLVCPTAWQRSQFPLPWRDHIQLIFDGVDTSLFYPDIVPSYLHLTSCTSGKKVTLQENHKVLSYATRGMEPLRGFPEFMRAAAAAQALDDRLQVVIAGRDQVTYSYHSPHPTGSWKNQMLKELRGQLDLSRLHFTGLLNYGELVQLYRRSDLHCYFTRPYVLSWSVFEAAATGARLLVNDFPGLDEVVNSTSNCMLVNLDDQKSVNLGIINGLESTHSMRDIRPCSNLSFGKDLDTALRSWLALIKK